MAKRNLIGIPHDQIAPLLGNVGSLNQINAGLGNLASSIEAAIAAGGVDSDVVGFEAIPENCGVLTYIDTKLKDNDTDWDDNTVLGWMGIMCIVGLSCMMGFDLSVRDMDVSQVNNDTSINKTYTTETEFHTHCVIGDKVTLLEKNGIPIAYFHDTLGWIPFAEPSIIALADVPWFDARTKSWKKIESDEVRTLDAVWPDLYTQLVGWLRGISANNPNPLRNVACMVGKQVADQGAPFYDNAFASAIARANNIVGNPNINTLVPISENFNTVNANNALFMSLMNVPDGYVPKNVWSPYLMVIAAENIGKLPDGIDLKFIKVFQKSACNLSVLLPITKECIKFLNDDPATRIVKVKVDADHIDIDTNGYISVSIEFAIGAAQTIFRTTHTYYKDHIRYARDAFPAMSLWPYIKVAPNAFGVDWKKYYVTMSKPADTQNLFGIPGAVELAASRFNIDMDGCGEYSVSTLAPANDGAENYDAYRNSWRIATFNSFPEYVHLTYISQTDREPIDVGCVYIAPPAETDQYNIVANKTAYAAIDFGTTNSVCAVSTMIAGNSPVAVNNSTLVNPSYVLDLNSNSDGDFHRYYWMSKDKGLKTAPDGKTRTVAQVYDPGVVDGAVTDLHLGRMILSDPNVINHFSNPGKSLEDFGIYGNIKFQPAVSLPGVAAKMFVSNLVLNCALIALKEQCQHLSLIFSYPDEYSLNNLTVYWTQATQLVNDIVGLNFLTVRNNCSYEKMTESEAAARHEAYTRGLGTSTTGFSVADIGGGTSDISVWRSVDGGEKMTMHNSYSLRFAGNQILANSVLTVFRKYSNLFINEASRESIWMMNNPDSRDDKVAFNNVTDSLCSWSSAVSTVAPGGFNYPINNFVNSLNSMLDIVSFKGINMSVANEAQVLLCSLVRMKMAGLFYFIAQMIKQSPTCAIENLESEYLYSIPLAGGGSRSLELCGQDFEDNFIKEYLLHEELKQRIPTAKFDILKPGTRNKIEVVDGMCNKVTDSDPTNYSEATDGGFVPNTDDNNRLMNSIKEIIGEFAEKYLNATYTSYGQEFLWFPYKSAGNLDRPIGEVLMELVNSSNFTPAFNIALNYLDGTRPHCPMDLFPYVMALQIIDILVTKYL